MLLSDLIGQDHAVALLERAIDGNRLAHTYLFDGPEGVGKRSAALAFGRALVCKKNPGRGCTTCDACLRVDAGNHPDVRFFSPGKTQIVIEDAQAMVAVASERPHEAKARVIVIDEADRLNTHAANCLLKTLEEPAPDNHFVLVTAAPDRLLSTVRSRAQRVRFLPVPAATLTSWLKQRGVPAHDAELAAALSDGSVARALELTPLKTENEAAGKAKGETRNENKNEIKAKGKTKAKVKAETEADADAENAAEKEDETGASPWTLAAGLRAVAGRREVLGMMDAAATFSGNAEDRQRLSDGLTLLARFYRDALVAAAGAPQLVVLAEHGTEINALAATPNSVAVIRKALGSVVEALDAVAANVNPATATEMLLFRLAALEGGVRAGS